MGYDWLLFFHVLAAMVWLGGVVVLAALATTVVRGGDGAAVARLTATLRRIGPIVLAPAPLTVLGFGIALVLDSGAWSFGQTWVEVALGLFAAALLVGVAHQAQAAIAAERAAAAGREADALRHLRRWTVGAWVLVAVLAAVTWDMVLKPGL